MDLNRLQTNSSVIFPVDRSSGELMQAPRRKFEAGLTEEFVRGLRNLTHVRIRLVRNHDQGENAMDMQ